MMRLQLVTTWLSHFTYKPGVSITANLKDESVQLDIRYSIIDWRDLTRGRRRLLCSYLVPDAVVSAQQFFRWLHEAVLPVFDRHEHNEFFLVDGVAIFDPHDPHPPGLRSLDEQVLATPCDGMIDAYEQRG